MAKGKTYLLPALLKPPSLLSLEIRTIVWLSSRTSVGLEWWRQRLGGDVIAGGVFTSVDDLRRKLMKYTRAYAKHARPIRWTYTDPKTAHPTNRIIGTAH